MPGSAAAGHLYLFLVGKNKKAGETNSPGFDSSRLRAVGILARGTR